MQILGNIIWIVCGGFLTAAEYFVGAIGCFLTIVGIPFGIQLIKLGKLALLPFEMMSIQRSRRVVVSLQYLILFGFLQVDLQFV